MCSEENRDQFEEIKEEIKEAAQNLAEAVKEKAEEWKEKAEEFCEKAEEACDAEDISDLGKEDGCECNAEKTCEGETCDFEAAGDEEEKKESRFIRRTPKGFEVDTNEIEEALRSFGEKISEAMNSVGRGVQDSINAAQDRANAKKKADKLAKLLPFMEEAEIHEIAEKVIAGDEEFKDVDIASLMPFMSEEDCALLFEKSLQANDENPGVDGKLYLKAVPYVGEEALSKLVDRYIEGGYENIKMDNIYPYLSSADVKRIFYYELRK